MKKEDGVSKQTITIGGASLILIFMIMALNTFCLLSISIAQRDLDRADRIGNRVQDYYRIDTMGDRYLEEVYHNTSIKGIVEKDLELSENRSIHIKLNKGEKLEVLEWNIQNKDVDIDNSMGVVIIE